MDQSKELRARLHKYVEEYLAPRAARYAEWHLQQFGPSELASVIRSFGHLAGALRCRSFLRAVCAELQGCAQDTQLGDLVRFALAFHSILDFTEFPHEPQVGLSASRLEGHAEVHELAHQVAQVVAFEAESRVEQFKPCELASFLGAVSQMRMDIGALWNEVVKRAGEQMHQHFAKWSKEDAIRLLRAVSRLHESRMNGYRIASHPCGVYDDMNDLQKFMSTITQIITEDTNIAVSMQDLSDTALALGRLADHSQQLQAFMHATTCRLQSYILASYQPDRTGHLRAAEFANMVWSLAKLGVDIRQNVHMYDGTVLTLRNFLDLPFHESSLRYGSYIIWAYAWSCKAFPASAFAEHSQLHEMIHLFAAMVRDSLVEPLCCKMSKELSMLLWSLAVLLVTADRNRPDAAGHVHQFFQTFTEVCTEEQEFSHSALMAFSPCEITDVFWAFGCIGFGSYMLQNFIVNLSKLDIDCWLAPASQSLDALGNLLWGAVALLSGKVNQVSLLHSLATTVREKLSCACSGSASHSTVITALWCLASLGALTAGELVSTANKYFMLSRTLGKDLEIDGKAQSFDVLQWSQLWEIFLLCEPHSNLSTLPSEWLARALDGWKTLRERDRMADWRVGRLQDRLKEVLTRLGIASQMEVEIVGQSQRGVIVDAVPIQHLQAAVGESGGPWHQDRWCVEILLDARGDFLSDSGAACQATTTATHLYGKQQAKRRFLECIGWRVIEVSAKAL